MTARDSVRITSEDLPRPPARGAKMAAKASSVTTLGRLWVMEMGRCCEKKVERARLSTGRCCVEGTLGSFCTEGREASCLALRLRLNEDEEFEEEEEEVEFDGVDGTPGRAFEPLSGLEGFDDE